MSEFSYWWRWTSNFSPAVDAIWVHHDHDFFYDEEPWALTWAVLFLAMFVVAAA